MAASEQPDRFSQYIPGVCNIGRAEVRLRRVLAWVALAVSIALWATFVAFNVAPGWRLLLFFPATGSAAGFLQAAWHFCAKFGLAGVFNFGPDVGRTDTVEQAEYRRKDRHRAFQIMALSGLIGAAVAAVAFFIPR